MVGEEWVQAVGEERIRAGGGGGEQVQGGGEQGVRAEGLLVEGARERVKERVGNEPLESVLEKRRLRLE